MNNSTLCVNPSGAFTMEALNYPQYRVQGYAYWIVFHKAVLMIREGWIFYWLEGQPDFEKNHTDAMAMPVCDRSEALEAFNHEVGILKYLSENL